VNSPRKAESETDQIANYCRIAGYPEVMPRNKFSPREPEVLGLYLERPLHNRSGVHDLGGALQIQRLEGSPR
jgi:hypothetical protein